jgi:hypothetical protein
MSHIIARRIGRLTFGAVLLAGVAFLLVSYSASIVDGTHGRGVDATHSILYTWMFALIAGAVARIIVRYLELPASADWLFGESWMVLAVGMALLVPITLHMPILLLLGGRRAFDEWVWASIWITGLAHIVFATMCAIRARQLVAGQPAWSPGKILKWTVLTSAVPFAILLGIPPCLVLITGAVCLPLLSAMERLIERERCEADDANHALPRAIVVPRLHE